MKNKTGEGKAIKIVRKGLDWWVDGEKHRYHDYELDKQELMICSCGCQQFWIYQPRGDYETNAICKDCLKSYCVHDG
jgi:hypothetical protein